MKVPKALWFTTVAAFLVVSACSQAPSKSTQVRYGASMGMGSAGAHTVLKGDTLYSISKQYQLPVTEIVTLNNISQPYTLKSGFRLKLPPPNEHKVRGDDTVQGVARTYGVSPSQIVALNDLSAPYALSAGQVLRLPTPTMRDDFDRYDVAQGTIRSARVDGVERETLGSSGGQGRVITSEPLPSNSQGQSIVPNVKPKVQKASSAVRSKAIEKIPKRSGNGKFMRPVEGKIISDYGPKDGGLHNDGINIKAARGAPVRAAENGRVVYVGDDLEGYGNLILVRHADRYMSAYAHLDKSLVKKGDAVKRGQSIGTVGSSGQVSSPQLHFEVRKGTKALDPQKYL